MASVKYGDAQVPHLIYAEEAYVGRIASNHDWLNDLFNVVGVLDLSGGRTLTEAESRWGSYDFFGAIGGDQTVTVDDTFQKMWWVRDRTTGGNLTLKPASSTGTVLPKGQWVLLMAPLTNLNFLAGWYTHLNASSITYNTPNWGATSGRTPRIWHEDATHSKFGGIVKLEGAVEKSTADPAIDDTILTLPQYHRPNETAAFVVPVNSDVTTMSEQGFGPILYTGGRTSATGVTAPMFCSGKVLPSVNSAYRAVRAGSITGIGGRFNVTSHTTPDDCGVEVFVNNVSVFEATVTTSGVQAETVYATQAPGNDLVAADDRIHLGLKVGGSFVGSISNYWAAVEILTTPTRRTTTVEIGTDGVMKLRGPLPEIGETIDLSGIQYKVGN